MSDRVSETSERKYTRKVQNTPDYKYIKTPSPGEFFIMFNSYDYIRASVFFQRTFNSRDFELEVSVTEIVLGE